ncbi:hypothetical protein Nepgr_026748 [Nepenthes gracilis]|uniref:Uncharacterized protein n=1 Tax=Nepenthes gracilis TaxID=150966 RepID=A0AAD3T7E7_NEPGR|nr:hypothetical protein Nepgr_026748 [Nepenthes gracilis]
MPDGVAASRGKLDVRMTGLLTSERKSPSVARELPQAKEDHLCVLPQAKEDQPRVDKAGVDQAEEDHAGALPQARVDLGVRVLTSPAKNVGVLLSLAGVPEWIRVRPECWSASEFDLSARVDQSPTGAPE